MAQTNEKTNKEDINFQSDKNIRFFYLFTNEKNIEDDPATGRTLLFILTKNKMQRILSTKSDRYYCHYLRLEIGIEIFSNRFVEFR